MIFITWNIAPNYRGKLLIIPKWFQNSSPSSVGWLTWNLKSYPAFKGILQPIIFQVIWWWYVKFQRGYPIKTRVTWLSIKYIYIYSKVKQQQTWTKTYNNAIERTKTRERDRWYNGGTWHFFGARFATTGRVETRHMCPGLPSGSPLPGPPKTSRRAGGTRMFFPIGRTVVDGGDEILEVGNGCLSQRGKRKIALGGDMLVPGR